MRAESPKMKIKHFPRVQILTCDIPVQENFVSEPFSANFLFTIQCKILFNIAENLAFRKMFFSTFNVYVGEKNYFVELNESSKFLKGQCHEESMPNQHEGGGALLFFKLQIVQSLDFHRC
jgi:hypothetical protein